MQNAAMDWSIRLYLTDIFVLQITYVEEEAMQKYTRV